MTTTFHALWMLCALGALVIATWVSRPARELPVLGAGFLAAALLTGPDRLPDAVWMGALAVGAVAIYLCWPRYSILGAGAGGALAGAWSSLMQLQGLPAAPAVAVAAAAVALSWWLSRTNPSFAPEAIREEGLLAIAALGLGVAMLPAVLDGWQSAAQMNVPAARDEAVRALPLWTTTLVTGSIVCGALYAVWSRR
jgi:hypothetical protein